MLSIVIPVKNQLHYTKHIIEDVALKVKVPYELIIINDNSTDGTREYLNSLNNCAISVVHYDKDLGVNHAWNEGVARSKGEYVWVINNDIVLTEGVESTLLDLLKDNKIACPYTTEGKHKFVLPLIKKSKDVAGWCFMMKKEDWKPIDPRLDIWFGDTWQFHMANKSVGWGGTIHHYCSKTLLSDELRVQIQKRINKDKLAWDVIWDEFNFS